MNARIVVDIASRAEAEAQRPHLQQGGFFLPWLEPPPEPFASVLLDVVSPSSRAAGLAARVVHLAAGVGIALAFDDAASARAVLLPLIDGLPAGSSAQGLRARWHSATGATNQQSSAADADPHAADPDAQDDVEASPPPEGDAEETATLFARIRAMKVPEKIQLAAHGDRAARLLLMKDPNKVIHNFIIQNPRITIEEVRYLAGYRQANPDTLKLISEHREWMQNPGVMSALASNPKTPPLIAVKLIDRLPMSEVRRLAKSDSVVRSVQLAARKRVAGPG